ncbi:MAG: hypothetical protein HWE34_04490 [Methylocystaceae bacterium]|nr:hypothetical protein [Methylocystaceae bacterium]
MTKKTTNKGALANDFFYPPFSTLDARSGWWQDRKRKWLNLGIESELGRVKTFESLGSIYDIKKQHIKKSKHGKQDPSWATTSIFDPVLCEILYKWFAPEGGHILDPFAGGSVRGLVASYLGYRYTGFDIRQEQIDANVRQARTLLKKDHISPVWKNVDACSKSLYKSFKSDVDLIFTCPPYGDLEVYSDHPTDISNMPFDTFAGALKHSIKQASARLKDNRFAIYVVSDIRDRNGEYRGLPDIVRHAGKEAGLKVYSELVLLNALGTLPLRARGYFEHSRKIGRAHQNIVLFVKGDPVKANADIGAIPCKDPF